MQRYFAVLTIVLMLGMGISRVLLLKRNGVTAMNFGEIDQTEFLILPFALSYFYLIFANTFNFPTISRVEFFHSEIILWIGVFFCFAGLLLLIWSLVSFGQSFRVAIDTNHPNKLITSGIFSISRNPIYVALAFILLGQFLIFSNWILLVYTGAAVWFFHRQVLREEDFLKKHFDKEYYEYCSRVRRYL